MDLKRIKRTFMAAMDRDCENCGYLRYSSSRRGRVCANTGCLSRVYWVYGTERCNWIPKEERYKWHSKDNY